MITDLLASEHFSVTFAAFVSGIAALWAAIRMSLPTFYTDIIKPAILRKSKERKEMETSLKIALEEWIETKLIEIVSTIKYGHVSMNIVKIKRNGIDTIIILHEATKGNVKKISENHTGLDATIFQDYLDEVAKNKIFSLQIKKTKKFQNMITALKENNVEQLVTFPVSRVLYLTLALHENNEIKDDEIRQISIKIAKISVILKMLYL